MTRSFAIIATVAALSAAAPALANSQLIASAGLTAEQAEGLTLNQIAAAKANRGVSFSDRQAVVIVPGDAGVSSADLLAFAVEKYNRGRSFSDRQEIVRPAGATVSSRSVVDTDRHAQLIAAAGLTPDQAEGLTLDEIVAFKANRGQSASDARKVPAVD